MDVEERYKEKGKKVSKPFGGASRGSSAAKTKIEKKEENLRSSKKKIKIKRALVWDLKGDVVAAASSTKRKASSANDVEAAKKEKTAQILAMCFLEDGSGNGACMAGLVV